jgi:hypothetical protein
MMNDDKLFHKHMNIREQISCGKQKYMEQEYRLHNGHTRPFQYHNLGLHP